MERPRRASWVVKIEIVRCSSMMLMPKMTMSSAYAIIVWVDPSLWLIVGRVATVSRIARSSSIVKMMGEITHPCLTPFDG